MGVRTAFLWLTSSIAYKKNIRDGMPTGSPLGSNLPDLPPDNDDKPDKKAPRQQKASPGEKLDDKK